MSKTALVLGGGGAKGAYEAGVMKALKELNINIDIITGCSVGSINGAIAAQGEVETALKIWKSLSTGKVLDLKDSVSEADIKGVIENSGFEYTNLKKLLTKYIDEEKIRLSPVDFGLVTVRYPEMTPLYIFKEDMEKGSLIDYVLASCAFFPAMRPYEIGKKLYVDGGFSDNLPVNMALSRGATRIIAVDLKAVGFIKKPKDKNANITKISCYYDLGKILEFDSKRSKANIKLGYLDTMKAFSKLDGFKYTFYKNEITKHLKVVTPEIEKLFNKIFCGVNKPFKTAFKKAFVNLFKIEIARGYKPSHSDLALYSLESLMELLNLGYFETYRIKKAHFLIRKKLKECDVSSLYELNDTLLKLNTAGNIADVIKKVGEAIQSFDKIKFIKLLSENIDTLSNSNPRLLIAIGICAPKEFFSALYLKFI